MKQACTLLSLGQTVAVVINISEEEKQVGVKIPAERVPGIKKAWTAKQGVGVYQPLRDRSGTEQAIKEKKKGI